MGRAQLRAIEKRLRRQKAEVIVDGIQKNILQASKNVENKLLKEQREAMVDEDAVNSSMMMYLLFGTKLHELYGFGQQRLLRLFDAVDTALGEWRRSGEGKSLDQMREELKKAVDIDIDFGDWRHHEEKE